MTKRNLSLAERQPILVRAAAVAAVTAVVHVFVVLGVVDGATETAIGTAVDALGALGLIVWSIQSVTPNAKVVTQVTTEGDIVAGDAAVADSGTSLGVATLGRRGQEVPATPPVPVKPELVDTSS